MLLNGNHGNCCRYKYQRHDYVNLFRKEKSNSEIWKIKSQQQTKKSVKPNLGDNECTYDAVTAA